MTASDVGEESVFHPRVLDVSNTLGYSGRVLTLNELAAAISGLERMSPIDRARVARTLPDLAKTVLSATADAAVVEALAGGTYAEVARRLEVSESAVNKAVTRHRARSQKILP